MDVTPWGQRARQFGLILGATHSPTAMEPLETGETGACISRFGITHPRPSPLSSPQFHFSLINKQTSRGRGTGSLEEADIGGRNGPFLPSLRPAGSPWRHRGGPWKALGDSLSAPPPASPASLPVSAAQSSPSFPLPSEQSPRAGDSGTDKHSLY